MTGSLVCALVFVTCFSACSAATGQNSDAPSCPALSPVEDSQFKPGDVWMYTTRPEEPASTVTILKVESRAKIGTIIHVQVRHIHMVRQDGFVMDSVQHMPFTREALAASVTRKVSTGPLPEYSEGYTYWASHCGGVYTISVREAVDVMQKTLLKGASAN